jgi:TusA-related sulfurtransferase
MPSSSEKKLQVDQSLDVRGQEAPAGYHAAVQRLSAMADEEILELFIDDGEALRTVPFGLRAEGHEIVVSEPSNSGVRLLVRKRVLVQ